jgi:hypothetical protein
MWDGFIPISVILNLFQDLKRAMLTRRAAQAKQVQHDDHYL